MNSFHMRRNSFVNWCQELIWNKFLKICLMNYSGMRRIIFASWCHELSQETFIFQFRPLNISVYGEIFGKCITDFYCTLYNMCITVKCKCLNKINSVLFHFNLIFEEIYVQNIIYKSENLIRYFKPTYICGIKDYMNPIHL